MTHPLSRYRLRLLNDFIRIILFPLLLFILCFYVSGTSPSLIATPLYLPFAFACALIRNLYSNFQRGRDAQRRGARLPPEVVGSWPGNIDILIKRRKATQAGYLAEFYRELFHEYHSTTLNLKLLWIDMVCVPSSPCTQTLA